MNAKKDWELNRLKALKEEEERRLELEEDEMLYTYSRDDAYQQVKKRNKQMVQAHRRAAAAAKADALSPVRKSVRLIGGPVDSDPEFVDPGGTPVLFSGKGRGRGRGRKSLQHSPSKTPKSTPSPSPKKLGRKPGKAAAAGEKTKLSAQKLSKKSKVKVSTVTDANDNGEEIDVETVAKDEETIKKLKKSSKPKTAAADKPAKKPGKRSPKIILKHITAPSSGLLTTGSTEATSLQSLPGYSSSNPIDIDSVTPRKVDQDNPARTNLLNKLTPVKSKKAEKPRLVTHDRGNIFEHFGQNVQPGLSSATNLLPTQLPSGSVRLINTQDGRQMVVVSSASVQPTQNLVLVQGMQGLPQGLILGNNILPIQSTPVNMATFTRGISPLGLSGARLQSSQQIISPQFAPQITPAVPSPTNQAFVQRLVNVQQSPSIGGLSLGSVQQLAGLTIQRPPSQLVSGIGQINTQQIRLSTPSVQNPTVVSSPSQPTPPPANRLISPKKSASHTIADLIEARNLASSAAKVEKTALKPPGGGEPSALGLSKLLPNLSNIMKAQVPVGSEGQGKVRVNPTVAQLVASHINAAAAQAESSQQKVNRPAIITASSTTRSASPTIVKLVAASSLRAGSPVNKVQTMPVQVRTATGEPGKPQPSLAPPSKTDSPVATINIKGLPPGVTIPVSLVNSLVSGSIGGINRANLNVLRGVPPSGQPAGPKPTTIRPSLTTTIRPVMSTTSYVSAAPATNVQVKPSIEIVKGNSERVSPIEIRGSPIEIVKGPERGSPIEIVKGPSPIEIVKGPERSSPIEIVKRPFKPIVTIVKSNHTEIQTPSEVKPAILPVPAIKTITSPRLTIAKPSTDTSNPSSPTLQAWSNPNLVIRTRRAAMQQQNLSPIAPNTTPTVQPPIPIKKIVVAEKPATPTSQLTINQINVVHVNHTNEEQIPITLKKPEQNAVNIVVTQNNGSIADS